MNPDQRDLTIDHAKRLAEPFERIVVRRIESIGQSSITQKRPRRDGTFRPRIRGNRQFERHALIFAQRFLAEKNEFVPGLHRPAECNQYGLRRK